VVSKQVRRDGTGRWAAKAAALGGGRSEASVRDDIITPRNDAIVTPRNDDIITPRNDDIITPRNDDAITPRNDDAITHLNAAIFARSRRCVPAKLGPRSST
jgi:hypothetical protein